VIEWQFGGKTERQFKVATFQARPIQQAHWSLEKEEARHVLGKQDSAIVHSRPISWSNDLFMGHMLSSMAYFRVASPLLLSSASRKVGHPQSLQARATRKLASKLEAFMSQDSIHQSLQQRAVHCEAWRRPLRSVCWRAYAVAACSLSIKSRNFILLDLTTCQSNL